MNCLKIVFIALLAIPTMTHAQAPDKPIKQEAPQNSKTPATTKPDTPTPNTKLKPPQERPKLIRKRRLKAVYAILDTSIDGEKLAPIKIQLYFRRAKRTVQNFIALAEGKKAYKYNGRTFNNRPFYNGLEFHLVIDNFFIQTGDPTGTGRGGPGYTFPDEFHPSLKHNRPGVVAMANSGRNTNGSQFYITLAPQKSLDNNYTVFGQVVDGMESVYKIGKVPTKKSTDHPKVKVLLNKVHIETEYL